MSDRRGGPGGSAASAPLDALVSGRGLPALIAALDLAEVGLRVAVATGPVESFEASERDQEGVIAATLDRLATPIDGMEGDQPEGPALPVRAHRPAPLLLDPAGAWAPQAEPSVLGIPAVPLAADSLRLLGTAGAMRAYLDRVMPLLTIGKTHSFGELVKRRLGRAALERLSDPLLRERYGVPALQVDAAIAAPGLNEALSRAGALSAAALAYSDRNVARETEVAPFGGWPALVQAALHRLKAYGVELLPGRVTALEQPDGEAGLWSVELSGGAVESPGSSVGGAARLGARSVILDAGREATAGAAAEFAAIEALLPHHTRIHAEIDIFSPDGVPAGTRAVRSLDGWALRVEASDGVAVARLAGRAEAADSAGEADPVALDALLAEAGLTPVDSAEWRIERAAAPFATIADRDRVLAELADRRRLAPTLLSVGRLLHGDDLGAAVAAADADAVVLRRHLLGLAD